jgi:hypothetical protein
VTVGDIAFLVVIGVLVALLIYAIAGSVVAHYLVVRAFGRFSIGLLRRRKPPD